MSTGRSNEPEDASILADPNQSAINVVQRMIDERFSSLNLGSRVTRDLSKHLGTGAYGVVYAGTLLPEQTSVAVKVIRSGGNSVLPVLERILREVHVWSALHHENILPLLGITTVFDDTISIVSPLMSRGNAFQYVQDPNNDPRPLVLGLARALGYLHSRAQPIIHGDIKGSNVLVSDDGRVQLADFGFSSTVQTSLGAEQRVGGTLNWIAPEYVEADNYTMTTAGDIWAFGMTTLELFTRMRPYHHLNGTVAIVHRILTGPPERPSAEVTLSRLTDGWWEICLACWVRDPTLRSTMSKIAKKIVSLDATSNVTIPASEPTQLHTTSETVINDASLDPRPALQRLRVVERASRYSIILDGRVETDWKVVNKGEYGFVSKGILHPEGIEVAIKTPPGGLEDDEDTIKCFLREAHMWSKLRHENVLPIIGITTDFNLSVFIVSPWMERGTARDYVQDRNIDPRPLILGTARGLHYLHNHPLGPIVHGDVKGDNVLISDNGLPLLHNFGFSLIAISSFSMSATIPTGAGTLRWKAPELLDGDNQTLETDVWAFGMLMLELFTRMDPFHSCSKMETVIYSIIRGPPARPSDEDTCFRLTDGWWNICLSCWERDPQQRPTMSQIIARTVPDISPAAVHPHDEETGVLQGSVDNLPEVVATSQVGNQYIMSAPPLKVKQGSLFAFIILHTYSKYINLGFRFAVRVD
ncbi:hypothetical protein ID866_6619 [Astraeus odoratus]|nr:hypothetical protein ID866_6619 [Astraeus odoratus]